MLIFWLVLVAAVFGARAIIATEGGRSAYDRLLLRTPVVGRVVRLLGIKAFDPKVNDPGLSEVGNACVRALVRRFDSPGALVVEYDQYKSDKAERLVAEWVAAPDAAPTEAWTCASCGERHEPPFELCWKCGADSDGNRPD